MIFPKCEQRRRDCFSCDETWHCHCLSDTKFKKRNGKTYKCPFYKPRTEVGDLTSDEEPTNVGSENTI